VAELGSTLKSRTITQRGSSSNSSISQVLSTHLTSGVSHLAQASRDRQTWDVEWQNIPLSQLNLSP
jgi:hypothetical protein